MNKLNLFNNSVINQAEFLKEYWHKKPLLLKNAINNNELKILPNKSELIQLSCHEDVQSRIVFKQSEDDYAVEFGPFIENDFDELNQNTWNLLVSDIDKWQPQSAKILKYFNFIRNWIFDDIMLSCGSNFGTVGPHTDHYDVFLIQVSGQRQWAFSNNQILNPEFKPDLELKLLSNFKADETHVLNPGDVLYLPPEIAHYGIANSDDCITCSIGMRTPSHSELMTSFVDYMAENKSADFRFAEPQFEKQPLIGEVTDKDIQYITKILTDNLTIKNQSISDWFGKYITEYRSLFYEFNRYQEDGEFNLKQDLKLSPFSKCCYFNNKYHTDLFVNGQHFESSILLAQFICNDKIITKDSYKSFIESDLSILKTLFENGSLLQNNGV